MHSAAGGKGWSFAVVAGDKELSWPESRGCGPEGQNKTATDVQWPHCTKEAVPGAVWSMEACCHPVAAAGTGVGPAGVWPAEGTHRSTVVYQY